MSLDGRPRGQPYELLIIRTGIEFLDERARQASVGRFDGEVVASFPPFATTLLVDRYLTNREAASARVFRVYKPTPHYHATCDEYLYVFSGRGTFWMRDASTIGEFGPGQLLFFEKGTHALPEIIEEPVVFLSVDTPPHYPRMSFSSIPRMARRKASLSRAIDLAADYSGVFSGIDVGMPSAPM